MSVKSRILDCLKATGSKAVVSDREMDTIQAHCAVYKALLDAKPLRIWRDARQVLCVAWDIENMMGCNEWYHYANGTWY